MYIACKLETRSNPRLPDGSDPAPATACGSTRAARLHRPSLAVLCAAAVLAAASDGSLASGRSHVAYADTARVIATRPVFQQVIEPQRQCTQQVVSSTVPGQARVDVGGLAGPVIGGVAGGVIGSQVGNGSGRTAATIAGAVAGTIAGSMIVHPQAGGTVVYPVAQRVDRVVERCTTVNQVRNVIAGYDVTYRYHGRDFTARMPYDPGRFVQVGVAQPPRGRKHRAGRHDDVRLVIIEQAPPRHVVYRR